MQQFLFYGKKAQDVFGGLVTFAGRKTKI